MAKVQRINANYYFFPSTNMGHILQTFATLLGSITSGQSSKVPLQEGYLVFF